MATALVSLKIYSANDAEFRAWGSGISAQLSACFGWVQCADTGQIDWVTVLRPGLGNTKAGYEIWRFDDPLQATAPVFLRIDFGTGSNVTNARIWFTIGTGTDGAGTVDAGGIGPEYVGNASHNAVGSCYFCGDKGRGVFATDATYPSGTMFFSIERTKDANGADTADGVLVTWATDNVGVATNWQQQYYQLGVGSQGKEGRLGILMPSVGSGVSDGNTAIYPQWIGRGPFLPYGLNLFGYLVDDIPALNTIVFTVYGAGHTYLPLGAWQNPVTGAPNGKSALLMRYE